MSITTKDSLIHQNAHFYKAFEDADIHAMDLVWAHADHVKCIHPGWGMLVGWKHVRESWVSIFNNGSPTRFTLKNIHAETHGKTGIVVLIEEVLFPAAPVHTASISATNIFVHDGRAWKMIHHHGSAIVGVREEPLYRYN